MTTLDMLEKRNQEFARHQFNANLSPMGTLKTMIVSCVDARVDPAYVLGLEAGDAMVVRTLGGRNHSGDATDHHHATDSGSGARSQSWQIQYLCASSYTVWDHPSRSKTRPVS